nr:MAG TPA: tail tape measure protein [Caudoviricetes sp.]
METVTGFSAALLASLGNDTEAAAEKADVAVTDMADNANKMGSSMESIQNAYQGFAKQNYTMLDNLKLGYGGTKEEMERLLENATKLSGVEYDISSYADIVDAIHVIQGEMGISGRTAEEAAAIYERTGRQVSEQLGTTAKEADSTIQGSMASLKAAWGNMVTGFISGEDWDPGIMVENVIATLETAAKNVAPRISQALKGMSDFISSAAGTIIPMAITTITDNLPALMQAAVSLVSALVQGIIDNLPAITQAALNIIVFLVDGLTENLPTLIDTIVQITITIAQMLTSPDFLTKLIDAAILLIVTLAQGLIDAIPQLIAAIPLIIGNLIAAIVAELPSIIAMGIDLLFALIDGIIQCIPELVAAIPTLIIAFINGLVNNLDKIILAGPQIIISLITGLIGAIPELIASVPRVIMAIVDTIRNYDWASIGKNIVEGLKNGIANMWSNIKNWFKDKVNGLVGGIKDALGIHSPSKVFAGIGENMALGLGQGWEDEIDGVTGEVTKTLDFNAGITAAPVEAGNNAIVMLLSKYLPLLANMQVVLSDGTLVGALAPELNAELARINALEDRAV